MSIFIGKAGRRWLFSGVLCLGITEGARAQAVEALRKSYEEEMARTVLPLREGYRKALVTLEGQLAAKGDYAGAARVREERLEIDRRLRRAAAASGPVGVAGTGVIFLIGGVEGGGVRMDADSWTGWEAAGGLVRWALPVGVPGGGYQVELVYTSTAEGSLPLSVREDFHTLSRVVKVGATVAEGSKGRVTFGPLRIRAGASFLELKMMAGAPVAGFRLFEVRLIPGEVPP